MKSTIGLALVLSVAIVSCVRTQAVVGTGTYQVLDLGVHSKTDGKSSNAVADDLDRTPS